MNPVAKLALILCLLMAGCQSASVAPKPVHRAAKGFLKSMAVVRKPSKQYSLAFSWDYSPDAGYRLYWGMTPGIYFTNLDVGFSTNGTATGLWPGTNYYFAATAYDSNGVESAFIDEARWPRPGTNVVTIIGSSLLQSSPDALTWIDTGVGSLVLTNPPGTMFYRGAGATNAVSITMTNLP